MEIDNLFLFIYFMSCIKLKGNKDKHIVNTTLHCELLLIIFRTWVQFIPIQ